ncbi:MAG: UPF0182 family protein, partial [Bryocella sp.]
MPQVINQIGDSPSHLPRRQRNWLLALAAVVILFIAARVAISYWVDLLWFQSLGYSAVFWRTRVLEFSILAAFTVVTFAILFAAFTVLKRLQQDGLPRAHEIVLQGSTVNLPVGPVLRFLTWAVSLGAAVITGVSMLANWPTFALFFYAPRTANLTDPIFSRPISFFLFTLPAWQLLLDWALTLAIIIGAFAVLLTILATGARALNKDLVRYAGSPWRALSVALSFLLLVLAVNVYVGRFQTILDHHTIFDGVTYTDAHITLTGLLFVCAALVLGAILAALNAARNTRANGLFIAVGPAVITYTLVTLVGWYVGSFIVKPNELVREGPFISHN